MQDSNQTWCRVRLLVAFGALMAPLALHCQCKMQLKGFDSSTFTRPGEDVNALAVGRYCWTPAVELFIILCGQIYF